MLLEICQKKLGERPKDPPKPPPAAGREPPPPPPWLLQGYDRGPGGGISGELEDRIREAVTTAASRFGANMVQALGAMMIVEAEKIEARVEERLVSPGLDPSTSNPRRTLDAPSTTPST